MPNFGFTPSSNQSSPVPNFLPYYGSLMKNPYQTPPFYGYMPMKNEIFSSGGAPPGFSTQVTIGGMTIANEVTPNPDDSTPKSRKNNQPAWITKQNLVLISGWIKFKTSSVVGRNQKGETYWGKIAKYCNEQCSFDPPRDEVACRNRFNYMNKILGKWIDAYEGAKRLQESDWSESDILAKAQELYACGKNVHFTLMAEWHALRDQPRYGSQVGGNIGSGNSGSKRSHESDACGSNSVGSSVRPIGKEEAKKKSKKKGKEVASEVVDKEWAEYILFKKKELERLDKIILIQHEANQLKKEKLKTKTMKLYLKLSSEEHLDDQKKKMLEKLLQKLFDN